MDLILFGPPGCGKGTQSEKLVSESNMVQLSTGDLFRSAIRNKTELGLLAKSFMDKGALVPDSVTIDLVKSFLLERPGSEIIFDGFPRTVEQAIALESLLKGLQRENFIVLSLEVDQSVLMTRLTGRRVCQNCGAVFHVETKKTKVEGVCDVCGGSTVQRPDDREEVIGARLEAYAKSTAPLKDFYKKAGKLHLVDGMQSPERVLSDVKKFLQNPSWTMGKE